jgi:predicted ATP-dependent endonuclease of OLD family
MLISKLQIEGLYDLYNYDISFDDERENQMTILTGPNGYGKTTILKILSSLKSKSLYYFYVIKFHEIKISFSDASILDITQSYKPEPETEKNSDRKGSLEKEVRFIWHKADGQVFSQFVYNRTNIRKALRSFRFLISVRGEEFDDLSSREKEEALLNNEEFNEQIANANGQSQFLMQLEAIRTYYIPSNRIYNEAHEENDELPIEKIRKALMAELTRAQRDFLLYSQQVDSKFIKSLLVACDVECSEESYRKLKEEVEERMGMLVGYQLTSKVEIPEFNEGNKNVLFAYLNGLKEKFGKYSSTLNKMNLFKEMLTSKRFANKSIIFSPRHGFIIKSNNGEFLNEYQLSSGEQNEIVMLYRLVYEVPDYGLLLIDEPENSLHVAWQKMIVDDLTRIASVKKLQIIIATHSPSIVSKGRSMARDLYYLMHT